MTEEERQDLREQLLGAKRIQTDAGTVEERSAEEVEKALKILERIEATNASSGGRKRSQLSRLGIYGRFNQ